MRFGKFKPLETICVPRRMSYSPFLNASIFSGSSFAVTLSVSSLMTRASGNFAFTSFSMYSVPNPE